MVDRKKAEGKTCSFSEQTREFACKERKPRVKRIQKEGNFHKIRNRALCSLLQPRKSDKFLPDEFRHEGKKIPEVSRAEKGSVFKSFILNFSICLSYKIFHC